MEVLPNIGLGTIRFGMRPAQVRGLMLEPETYEEWMGGNLNDSLLYRGLILGFDACDAYGPLADSHFTDVGLNRRQDAVIWGQSLLAWTKASIADHLERNAISYELPDNGDLVVSSLSLEMSFDKSGGLEYIGMWAPR
jgi:hypothetical protein